MQYNNIIFIAETQGDYELIRLAHDNLVHFIKNKKERKDSSLLSKAFILFGEEKKYSEASKVLEKLGNGRNIHVEIKKRKHTLMMKCLYEQFEDKQESYNALMKTAGSFRRMIYRLEEEGKISEKSKQCYYNYCNILCRIANQRNPSTKDELYALLESYNGLMVETKYIIAKIEEK